MEMNFSCHTLKKEMEKTLHTCTKGNENYKSSNCPTCPICEEEGKPENGFLPKLGAPARRTLENYTINLWKSFQNSTEKEILQWHGMAPATITKLKNGYKKRGFRSKKNNYNNSLLKSLAKHLKKKGTFVPSS